LIIQKNVAFVKLAQISSLKQSVLSNEDISSRGSNWPYYKSEPK